MQVVKSILNYKMTLKLALLIVVLNLSFDHHKVNARTHRNLPLKNLDEYTSTEIQQTVPPITQHPQPTKEEDSILGEASTEETEAQIKFGMNILEKTKCGESNALSRNVVISNGDDADLSEFPWMALLVYSHRDMKRTLNGGGTLITDRYVLTAAHCIRVANRKLVSVRLGEHDTTKPIDCVDHKGSVICAPATQEIDVEKAIYHKHNHPNMAENDIGLLRLVSPAIFRSNVQPVCLPITQSSLNATLANFIISGWGSKENGGQATILQKGVISLRENSYCEKAFKLRFTEYHLCAGGGDEKIHSCKGDSGGPTFSFVPHGNVKRFVQFGVISLGAFYCDLDFPSLSTRVEKYLNWIAGNLRL